MHRLTAGFLLAAALALPAAAFGQTATGSTASSQPPAPLPVITGPSDIPVGRTIVLDASFSTVPSERVTYQWFVDGSAQPISRAVEALYTPERPGVLTFRLVIESVTPDGTVQTVEATHPVVAYARKMILIADTAVEREKLELHRQTAEGAGVFLQILQPPESAIPFGQEEAFASFLEENKRLLLGASAIVLWSDSPAPLQAMSQAMSDDPEILQSIRTESIAPCRRPSPCSSPSRSSSPARRRSIRSCSRSTRPRSFARSSSATSTTSSSTPRRSRCARGTSCPSW